MKRSSGLTVSLVIFFIYFVYATKGYFYTVFTVLFPMFHIYLAVSAAIFGTLYITVLKNKNFTDSFIAKIPFIVLPVAMTITCIAVNMIYIISPQPDDGVQYIWISRLIYSGRLSMEIPHFYEHYIDQFMMSRRERYMSVFLPGFSLFLAPFSRFGIEFLFNPLVAGINTYLVGKHATVLKDRTAGIIAMILFVFSTTHIVHGALYFPHHFGLMLVLIATYIIVNKKPDIKNLIIAGVFLSIPLFIKPQNAFYPYFAVSVYLLLKEKSLKPVVFFTIPFLFTGTALMFYNYHFTGNPFLFVQDVYFNFLNIKELCHRPGFGKGCLDTGGHSDILPPEGVDLRYAAEITFMRLNNFLYRISVHPLMLVFILPAICKRPWKYFLYYFTPLCAVLAYATFFIEGNYFGPRYLFESGALFLIAAACGFSMVYGFFKSQNTVFYKFIAGSLVGLVVATMISFSVFVFPNTLFKTNEPKELHTVKSIIEEKGIENSIILMPFSLLFSFSTILNFHFDPPHDKKGNLVIFSLSHLNENIQKFYKGKDYREIWRVDRDDRGVFNIVPLDFLDDDGRFRVEFEGKAIPLKGEPVFTKILFPDKEDKVFDFKPAEDINLSFAALGILFEDRDKSYFKFEHSVKSEGLYQMETTLLTTGCTVAFDIEVNGKRKGYFKPQTDQQEMVKFTFDAYLNEGKNSFSIIPVPRTEGCLVLDYMTITRIDS